MRAANIGKAMSALLSSSIGRDDALLHLGMKSAVYFRALDKSWALEALNVKRLILAASL
jgi:hypothetical protein